MTRTRRARDSPPPPLLLAARPSRPTGASAQERTLGTRPHEPRRRGRGRAAAEPRRADQRAGVRGAEADRAGVNGGFFPKVHVDANASQWNSPFNILFGPQEFTVRNAFTWTASASLIQPVTPLWHDLRPVQGAGPRRGRRRDQATGHAARGRVPGGAGLLPPPRGQRLADVARTLGHPARGAAARGAVALRQRRHRQERPAARGARAGQRAAARDPDARQRHPRRAASSRR